MCARLCACRCVPVCVLVFRAFHHPRVAAEELALLVSAAPAFPQQQKPQQCGEGRGGGGGGVDTAPVVSSSPSDGGGASTAAHRLPRYVLPSCCVQLTNVSKLLP
eukprot:GHVU01053980.1.p4 GENE.GHVU01053980.1~~GHVU01053980.1.p4  ORF type:complete len:105 (-),score=6.71 GHVU01053980.1:655-969(-)